MSKTVFDNVKSQVAIPPIAKDSVATSAAIDTKGYGNLMVSVENGAATGGPSSYTVNAKLQHSDTSGESYTDIAGAVISEISADSKSAQIQLLGLGTGTLKRFIKVLVTPAMSGGSSPKALISAVVLLGQAHDKPVGNSATGA